MVLNIIVSFLVALLMGMGVGGGGLFVIFLTMCLNYGQIYVQGTNLVFFIIAILSSIFVHLQKRKLYFKQIFVMAIIGSIGRVIFSRMVNYVSPEIPKKMLGYLLVIGGAVSLYSNLFKKVKAE